MKPRLWRGVLTLNLFVLNTLFFSLPLLILAAIKALTPLTGPRRILSQGMVVCAETWIGINNWVIDHVHDIQWEVEGLEKLPRTGSFLVICNHQSWLDIPILQYLFNRRLPFFRFFLKSQLFYVPIFGLVWWALDFPFMKRHSPEELLRHPERRDQDLLTTKKSVARFRGTSVSVLNFIEGTRFTPKKQLKQNSPYQFLLKPKTGGLGYALQAMGEQFTNLIDVTIDYPQGVVTLWQAMCGHWRAVRIQVRILEIPPWTLNKDYAEDREYRQSLQAWIRQIWKEKDLALLKMRQTVSK